MEIALEGRQATIDAAIRSPGATADSVVSLLIAESYAVVCATAGMSSGAATGGAADVAIAKTMQDALRHANFCELATALAGLPTNTSADRCRVLLTVAGSKCALALRVLVFGTLSIARMHAALGKILESRADSAAYFGMVLTADPSTLAVPPRLKEFTWAGKQGTDLVMMHAFMNLKLQTLEWFNGETGINAINALMLGPHSKAAVTHPLDVYSTTRGVKQLCDFCHRITCAIGAPDTVLPSVGFTMLTFRDFYVNHLELSFSLATREEQIAWLDDSAQQFHLMLGIAETQLRQYLLSTQPDVAVLVCIVPYDCAPVAHLRAKEDNLKKIERQKDCNSWFQGPALVGHDPCTVALPLLSDYPTLVKFFSPLTAGLARKAKAPLLDGPKPKKAKKGDKTSDPRSLEPGCRFDTWMWLTPHKTLLLSGRVWDVAKITTALGIADPKPLAWPMLLSQLKDTNLPALLKAGDGRVAAHAPIAGIDPFDGTFRQAYCRDATSEEKAKLASRAASAAGRASPGSPLHAKGRGGRSGRGGRGGRSGGDSSQANFRQPA